MVKFALRFLAVLAVLAVVPAHAAPLGTAFTYQGKLTDSTGNPLTGSYDFTLKLYDALTVGTQIGSTVTLTDVPVAAGLFTVKLDFGASSFSAGAARWLETAVAGTTLSPRVELTSAPSASFSAAPWVSSAAGISYAGNVGIGATSPAYPLTFLDTEGDKISLYGLSGNHYGLGVQSNLLQIHTDGSISDIAFGYGSSFTMTEVMRIMGTGNVGIGTSAPAAKLHVAGTARMTGFQLGTSATAGQVLTTSATGVGTWQALPAPPASLPPSGAAGGDLTGTYPNPTIGTGRVDSGKILDGAVAAADLASDAASLEAVTGGVAKVVSGKIGIGTASPSSQLDVAGMASVDSINIRGATVLSAPIDVTARYWTLDQEQGFDDYNLFYAGGRWQSFTAGVSGLLAGIAVAWGSQNPALNFTATLSIYEGEGTAGTRLCTQTVAGDGTFRVRRFSLQNQVAVTAGSQYSIYIDPDITCNWGAQSTNPYAGGRSSYNAAWDHKFWTYVDAGTFGTAFTVQGGTGNVGVGEPAPGFPLSFPNVLGDKISLWGQSGAHYGFGIQSNLLQIYSSTSGADIAFGYGESSAMTETMRVKGNGNVGIGTSTPGAKLDVAGTARMTGFQLGTTATAGQVLTANTSGVGTWQSPPASLPPSGAAGGDLAGTYPNPTIAANAVGSAEIADGSIALADLAANSVNATKVVDASIAAAELSSDPASLSKVSGGAMTISAGNVGIGVAPTYKLHVGGTARVTGGLWVDDMPQVGGRNVQWDLTTHQFYQVVSSRRYKENIAPLEEDFQKLLLADPKTYTMKAAPDVRDIGYIAEQIDELGLKSLVQYDNNGRPDALKYEKMVLYLVEIAKDQKTQISGLQQQIGELKALVATLAAGNK